MFFHFRSIIYSLIFLAGFQIIFLDSALVWYSAIFLVIFSVWSAKKLGGRYFFSIAPVVFSFSSIILYYLIASSVQRQIFIIISGVAYYFILLGIYRLKNYSKDQTARGIVAGGTAAAIFFFYAGFYGFYLNFSIPLWILMFLFLAVTFVLSYYYFNILSPNRKKVLNYSLVLGMAMAQISWVINFWPFGYLTTGVIALIFYYVFWDLTNCYFLNRLSKRRVAINLIFFSLLIGLILSSSRWQLAV